ncbi:MAG: hypothetical protein AVDCRST_MAG13-106, partial [uncultured Solirubrobacteraceae bacterium]
GSARHRGLARPGPRGRRRAAAGPRPGGAARRRALAARLAAHGDLRAHDRRLLRPHLVALGGLRREGVGGGRRGRPRGGRVLRADPRQPPRRLARRRAAPRFGSPAARTGRGRDERRGGRGARRGPRGRVAVGVPRRARDRDALRAAPDAPARPLVPSDAGGRHRRGDAHGRLHVRGADARGPRGPARRHGLVLLRAPRPGRHGGGPPRGGPAPPARDPGGDYRFSPRGAAARV